MSITQEPEGSLCHPLRVLGWPARHRLIALAGRPGGISPLLIGADVLILAGYLLTGHALTGVMEPTPPGYWWLWLTVLWTATVIALASSGGYRQRLHLSSWEQAPGMIWRMELVLAGTGAMVGWLDQRSSLNAVVLAGASGMVGHLAARIGALALLRRARRSGHAASRTLVIGGGRVSRALVDRLDSHPEDGLLVLGYLDDAAAPTVLDPALSENDPVPAVPLGWNYLGGIDTLPDVVHRLRVQTILVGFGLAPDGLTALALRRVAREGVDVFTVPRLFEVLHRPLGQDHIGPMPLTRLRWDPVLKSGPGGHRQSRSGRPARVGRQANRGTRFAPPWHDRRTA